MSDSMPIAPTPTRHLWVIIGLVCVPVFLGSVDLTVVSAFLPALILELQLPVGAGGISAVSWILTSYLLMYSISLLIMGRISDFIGRRWALVICLVLYVIGATIVINYDVIAQNLPKPSINNGLSASNISLYVILFGRGIQALGAGAVTAIALALVGDIFPKEKRATPMGIIVATDTIGWLIGAAYAGVVVQFLPWRAIFLINMPLVLVALLAMLWALRGIKTTYTPIHFDILGTIAIIGALTTLNIAFATLDVANLTDSSLLPLLGISLICLLTFLLIESRVKYPLIRLGIFTQTGFSPAIMVNALVGFCLFISLASIPLLVNVKGLGDAGRVSVLQPDLLTSSALISGIMMGSFTIPLALMTIFSSRLLPIWGIRKLTLGGLVIGSIGFFAIWQLLRLDMPYVIMALMMAVTGIGLGITFTPVVVTVMNGVSESERGVASSLILGTRMVSMTVAVALLGVYADARVVYLVQQIEAGGLLIDRVTPQDYPLWFFKSYVNSTIQAVNEMALFGLILCAIGLIGAWLLPKNQPTNTHANHPAKEADLGNLQQSVQHSGD